MNYSGLIAASWGLNISCLRYSVYKLGEEYRIFDAELDTSVPYTQGVEKLNVYLRVLEMKSIMDKLVSDHGLVLP